MPQRTCAIDDCPNPPPYKRGWCGTHYSRWQIHGDPLGGRTRYKTPEEAFQGNTEQQGSGLKWTGSKTTARYGRIWVNGRETTANRYAWERANGPVPSSLLVDHKYHCDPACVTVDHLRLAT